VVVVVIIKKQLQQPLQQIPTLIRKHFSESSSPGSLPTDQALIYPPRLSDNQRLLADRYLAMINPEDRQLVLDELQGRLSSEQKGMKPVYDELRFLHSLCKAAQKGEFVPNLGIKVVEARQERASSSSTAGR
jgi:hypothetical protein